MNRYVSIYYRDENKVMRKIPNVELQIRENGSTVYTLPPYRTVQIRLNQPKLKESM